MTLYNPQLYMKIMFIPIIYWVLFIYWITKINNTGDNIARLNAHVCAFNILMMTTLNCPFGLSLSIIDINITQKTFLEWCLSELLLIIVFIGIITSNIFYRFHYKKIVKIANETTAKVSKIHFLLFPIIAIYYIYLIFFN